MDGRPESTTRKWICAILLTLGNTVTMMDKVTLTGVMADVQSFFKIDDGAAGALQSALCLSTTLASPLVGYLGDRMNRKFLIWGGVVISSFGVILGAFMRNYMAFFVTRMIIGSAQAFTLSNSCIVLIQ